MIRRASIGERVRILRNETYHSYLPTSITGQAPILLSSYNPQDGDTGKIVGRDRRGALSVEFDPPNVGRRWFKPSELERLPKNDALT